MTTRHALGRHRATPVRTNPLESISKAVSSNAGSVGRQAAVIAAASGLVLSIGVPAQATPATREASNASVDQVLQADLAAKTTSVQAPAVKVELGKKETKKAEKSLSVAGVKAVTDGADFRAAQKAEAEAQEAAEKAAAERQEAAQEAAAEERQEAAAEERQEAAAGERQEAAQEAAAERAEAQEAAAERRQAASDRQASSESTSSSSSSNDGADGAAMTRESRSGSSSNTTTTASTPKKEKKTKTVSSTGNSSIAAMAAGFKGAPYVWGGSTPGGWDCSGFVQYIYGKAGISLPHNTTAIRTSGKFAKTSSPKPGDLVYQNGGSHVGIYIGGGKIVGAQNPSVGTVERPADSQYGPLMGYYTYVG